MLYKSLPGSRQQVVFFEKIQKREFTGTNFTVTIIPKRQFTNNLYHESQNKKGRMICLF